MKIIILNCDFDPSKETNGAQLIKSHLSSMDVKEITIHKAFENQIPDEGGIKFCDGVIITGSRASVYEDLGWVKKIKPFILNLEKLHTPVLGICFGFQLITEFLGGKVASSGTFEEGYMDIMLTELGKQNQLFRGFPTKFKVYQSHGDVAKSLPAGSEILAQNNNSLQAYSFKNFSCVQFHPEILPSTAVKMAVRDGKKTDYIMNSVPEDYNLTLKILSNFVNYCKKGVNSSIFDFEN